MQSHYSSLPPIPLIQGRPNFILQVHCLASCMGFSVVTRGGCTTALSRTSVNQKFSSDIEHWLSIGEVPGIFMSNTAKQERKDKGGKRTEQREHIQRCISGFLTLVLLLNAYLSSTVCRKHAAEPASVGLGTEAASASPLLSTLSCFTVWPVLPQDRVTFLEPGDFLSCFL